MSDYLAAQQSIAFDYDATFEVVTVEDQKLGLASSGHVALARPDRIRGTRTSGFADVDMVFDGSKLTVLAKTLNAFVEVALSGTIDSLVDELRNTYELPLPATDLLIADPYAALTGEVTDAKDLGSGVVGGMQCDWLAFRTAEVDFEIWVLQGAERRPCRYVVTARQVPHAPQYTVTLHNWRTGAAPGATDFAVVNDTGAARMEAGAMRDLAQGLPAHFTNGDGQ